MASAVDIKIGADTSKARREIKQLGGVFAKLDRQSKRLEAAVSSPFMAVAAGAAAQTTPRPPAGEGAQRGTPRRRRRARRGAAAK